MTRNQKSNFVEVGSILSNETIEGAVNKFLNRDVFKNDASTKKTGGNNKSNCTGNKNCNSSESNDVDVVPRTNFACTNNCHPLFLLVVGPSNSGKTYFCNSLQSKVQSYNDGRIQGELQRRNKNTHKGDTNPCYSCLI